MIFKYYNDYELLYMIKHEQSEEALNIMFEKYKNFIGLKINSFRIYKIQRDDYFQEGLIILHKAIYRYDDGYGKTFLRFFEMCLERHFIMLGKKRDSENRLVGLYQENLGLDVEEASEQIQESLTKYRQVKFKSQREQTIYEEYFLQNKKINEIVKMTGYNAKSVYNTILRIRKKLKD
ncbi:MAG: hypothetical protein FWE36_02505 [Erysipelotrichales bacterium]|nr:hypothetical protein [Erysipelotrichales bacterium]